MRLDRLAVPRVNENAHFEPILGREVTQAIEILPSARELLRNHRPQGLPPLEINGGETAELDLAVAVIALAERISGRKGEQQRVRKAEVELFEQHAAKDRCGIDTRERHLEALDRLHPGPQYFGIGDGDVDHAIVTAPLGLASLGLRVAVG